MPNPEELAILKRCAAAWNNWRHKMKLATPDLCRANLRSADLNEADLRTAHLDGASLRWANLRRAKLNQAKLRGADLREANLIESNLNHADLGTADLNAANLARAKLRGTDLTRANLVQANLIGANLVGAHLEGANLTAANLSSADLRETDFKRGIVGGTTFANVDLSAAKDLETVVHFGPSTIGIDTIYRSKGNIPEAFLRGAGVPDSFVDLAACLARQPIQLYSCFLSFSSANQDVAQRLYTDLQARGVRCWFAPEDLKIGDHFRTRIDESIRLYDKLLLILSIAAIGSNWVEKEVETAFEKERKQKRSVLVPIRLDDAVMDTDEAWAADIRRTRHIGDFRCWKDHDAYQHAFARLLRDLKAEATG